MHSIFSLFAVKSTSHRHRGIRPTPVGLIVSVGILAMLGAGSAWAGSGGGEGRQGPAPTGLKAKVLSALRRGLHDKERGVRLAAVTGLEEMGAVAVPALLEATRSRDPMVRIRALQALSRVWMRVDVSGRGRRRTVRRKAGRAGHRLSRVRSKGRTGCFVTTRIRRTCLRLGKRASEAGRQRRSKSHRAQAATGGPRYL